MAPLRLKLWIPALLILSSLSLHASHILSYSVEYWQISSTEYVVEARLTRYAGGTVLSNGNCTQAAALPTNAFLTLYCPDQGFTQSYILPLASQKSAENFCDSSNSTMNSVLVGTCGFFGAEFATYRDTLDLSALSVTTCSQWQVVCENAATPFTLNTNTNQGYVTAMARFSDQFYSRNSSVSIFDLTSVVPFYHAGEPVEYHQPHANPDGDSLHWKIDTITATWSSSGTTPASYTTGYSGLAPIPGIQIDPHYGTISFMASLPSGFNGGVYLVGVHVEEYDATTGSFKAQSERIVPFVVTNGPVNQLPYNQAGFSSSSTTSGTVLDAYHLLACGGDTLTFSLTFADTLANGSNSGDVLETMTNIGQIFPGAMMTSSGTNPLQLDFSVPTAGLPEQEMAFTVAVSDEECPIKGYSYFTYYIDLRTATQVNDDDVICQGDTVWMNATGGSSFLWSVLNGPPMQVGTNIECANCASPWVRPTSTTTYLVQSNQWTSCGSSDTVTIGVVTPDGINLSMAHGGLFDSTSYCVSDGLDTVLASVPGGSFQGQGIVNANTGTFQPDLCNPGDGQSIMVPIIYTVPASCPAVDTIVLTVKGLPLAEILSTGPYDPRDTLVQLAANGFSGQWSDPSGNPNLSSSGSLYVAGFTPPDSILVIYAANDSGCQNVDSVWISILWDSAWSVAGIADAPTLLLYPNPSHDECFISQDLSGVSTLHVWSMDGRLLREQRFDQAGIHRVDTSSLPAGTYLITLHHADDPIRYGRLVKE